MDSTSSNNGNSQYELALTSFTAENRERVLRAAAKAGINEDEPLYSVIVAQNDIMKEHGQAVLTAIVKAIGDAAIGGQADLPNRLKGIEKRLTLIEGGIAKVNDRLNDLDKQHPLRWLRRWELFALALIVSAILITVGVQLHIFPIPEWHPFN
jgi:hypothetical protein